MSAERNVDWANIIWTALDWDTVDLVELRAAAMADLDPEWAAKYGAFSFDARRALLGGGRHWVDPRDR